MINKGRIINGFLSGRTVYMPSVPTTRPTSAAFKKSMFDILVHNFVQDFSKYISIDLFAGSGGIGIEAISLGCKRCYFVDNNKNAIDVIRKNIALLNIDNYAFVYNCEYSKFLSHLDKYVDERAPHDVCGTSCIIFLDPPYLAVDAIYDAMKRIANLHSRDVLFVIESKVQLRIMLDSITILDQRMLSKKWLTICSMNSDKYLH